MAVLLNEAGCMTGISRLTMQGSPGLEDRRSPPHSISLTHNRPHGDFHHQCHHHHRHQAVLERLRYGY